MLRVPACWTLLVCAVGGLLVTVPEAMAIDVPLQVGDLRLGLTDHAVLGIQEGSAMLPSSSGSDYTTMRRMSTLHEVNTLWASRGNAWSIAYDTDSATPTIGCFVNGYAACSGATGGPTWSWDGPTALAVAGSCGTPVASCSMEACSELRPGPALPTQVRVCHDVHASGLPDIAEIEVTVTSLVPAGGRDLTEIVYRRQMVMAPEPYPGVYTNTRQSAATYVLLDGKDPAPPALAYSSNNGGKGWLPASQSRGPEGPACSATPPPANWGPWQPGLPTGAWYPGLVGPCPQGALFEIRVGDLGPGASSSFRMYLGVRPDLASAKQAVGPLGLDADAYAIATATPDGSSTSFAWALAGLGPPRAMAAPSLPSPPSGVHLAAGLVCVGRPVGFQDMSTAGGYPLVEAAWDFGDGGGATTPPGAATSHAYARPGTFAVELRVKDAGGRTSADSTSVTVADCSPPVASFVGFPCVGERAVLQDTSVAGGLPLVESVWEWSDGKPTTTTRYQPSVVHVFRTPGPTSVRLTVTNGLGLSSSVSQALVVCEPAKPLPTEDADRDGVANPQDNCPATPNPAQADRDGNGIGDDCDAGDPDGQDAAVADAASAPDQDRDGVTDRADNCPSHPNKGQLDFDLDGMGDACDADADGDGILDASNAVAGTFVDNCPLRPNSDQEDRDHDGAGDACDGIDDWHVRGAKAAAPQTVAGPGPRKPATTLAWVVVAAGVAIVLAVMRRLRPRAWVAILFTRVASQPLEAHPVRRKILDAVRASPGITFVDLVNVTGRGRGTIRHHTGVLVASGFIWVQRTPHLTCYFAQAPGATDAAVRGALRSPTARRVMGVARAEPGISIAEAARRLGLAYRVASYHAHRLSAAGLIALAPDAHLRPASRQGVQWSGPDRT